MTYSEEQKRSHVYQLQTALYELGKNDSSLPRVNPDGIYGPETTRSVQDFQRKSNLPVTGNTDNITWNAIFIRYFREMRERSTPVAVQPYTHGPLTISRGQSGVGIGMAQLMLWSLSHSFSNIHAVPITLVLDDATIKQLHTVQSMSELSTRDLLDVPTWNALTVLFNLIAS